MDREKVLIVVKTYPVLSSRYAELVCTAGVRADGSWVRIYPLPFRCLSDEQQFKKYQWIELELEKNPRDPRPESFRPTNIEDITLLGAVPAGGQWQERRALVIDKNKVYTNLEELITAAKSNTLSLAIFKPARILDLEVEKVSADWEISRVAAAQAVRDQGSLFDDPHTFRFELMPKLPYKFRYKFEDENGTVSKLMIEDWEIGQLYWNCAHKHNEDVAIKKVKEKYFDDLAKTKDLHLILGTTLEGHNRKFPNPFVIVGTMYPEHLSQTYFTF